MNQLKTGLLLAGLTALFVVLGGALGGQSGMFLAFGLAVVMNVAAYWFSDRIVLGMTHAVPVTAEQAPELTAMVRRLSERAGIPEPRLYIVEDPTPNAFATGRNPAHSAVAVNTGLLAILDRNEVEGVVAHEIAHIKNRDTLISTIAATFAGAIGIIAHMARWGAILGGFGGRDEDENPIAMLGLAIVAPIMAMLIQFAVSRSREYLADRTAGELTGRPLYLASALGRLEEGARRIPGHHSPATAHMYIVNPLRGGGLMTLFSTHPRAEDRIARLRRQAQELGNG